MADEGQSQRSATEQSARQGRIRYIFDHPYSTCRRQRFAGDIDEQRVITICQPREMPHPTVSLARRRRVNGVKLVPVLRQILERVRSVKFKRKVRLWHDVNTNDLESSLVVSHCRTACATEQVE